MTYIRYYGNNNKPTFECKNDSDLYTTNGSTDGNKALTYPIGLISMDEVWYAGGYKASNQRYYLYNGHNYYTISPSNFDGSSANVFYVNSVGYLSSVRVDSVYNMLPVINLKSEVTISRGNGTSTNPYVIS